MNPIALLQGGDGLVAGRAASVRIESKKSADCWRKIIRTLNGPRCSATISALTTSPACTTSLMPRALVDAEAVATGPCTQERQLADYGRDGAELALAAMPGNRRFGSTKVMDREIAACTTDRNAKGLGSNWQFTTDDARIKLKSLYPRP